MADQFELFFVQRFKGKVLFGVSMKEYTSFRIGGPADVMAFPEGEADLRELLTFASAKGFPVFFLGGGTNLLVRDAGIRGIVINLTEGFKDVEWAEGFAAFAGAGMKLSELVRECAERGLGGLEFAVGIPGTLGGAVVMNAGAYGGEMKDLVEGVEVMTLKGKKGFISKNELGFGYRSSKLPPDSAIVRVHLKFTPVEGKAVKKKIDEVRIKRAEKGAIGFPSAGCVFKNPAIGDGAGKLIEEAGLKGVRSGNAVISEKHANYIVNSGDATARDVLSLMALIRDKVFGMKGVVLEPEIKVVGED